MEQKLKDEVINNLKWRNIGPPRGGRTVAVAGHPTNLNEYYFGACAGGVWKTDDAGISWKNVSDGFFNTSSIGAIAVSESDPNVLYAGTGEACIRGNVSPGDGVYKSTDAGRTWSHVGLSDTKHISRVRIDPTDHNTVYVAALGHAFGPNDERGIFKSNDGGENWKKVLFISKNSGAADLSMDPGNPRILITTIWQAKRSFWKLDSGGPESGIYISFDSGDNWENITKNPGLPEGLKGRMGVSISPAKEGRIWATIESEIDTGVYRTENYGKTWNLVSDDQDLQGRPWYYQHIFADPSDENTVWVMNYSCHKSTDGGKTFELVSTPHGDNHDIWIDPNDSNRLIQGNDGGANVSFNGGESWSTIYNQKTSQFYHVHTDNQFPYRVYGTQQDNSAISVPYRTETGAITWSDCYITGTSESGYIVTDPENANLVYSGSIGSSPGGGGNMLRYDHSTGQVRIVTVWPVLNTGKGADEMKFRFQWTYPIQFSPHDPKTLYVAGNIVFKSINGGQTWEEISPDLTTNDKSKQAVSGGEITKDTSAAETYCTIYSFLESPYKKGLMWAGSDDGLIHVTQDNAKTWNNVTPKDFPEWARIHCIELSPHDDSTAYVVATKNMLDDYSPIIYKTTNNGKSWERIDKSFPRDEITRVLRVDKNNPDILYVGTETGLFLSFDDATTWSKLNSNLPVVPIYDIDIKDNNMILATHGRSFWILDDITAISQLNDDISDKSFILKPTDTYRILPPFGFRLFGTGPDNGKTYSASLGSPVLIEKSKNPDGEVTVNYLDSGENPPMGVPIYFYLDSEIDKAELIIKDTKGKILKSFSNEDKKRKETKVTKSFLPSKKENKFNPKKGFNTFVWDMYCEGPYKLEGEKLTEGLSGPMALPGIYNVEIITSNKNKSNSLKTEITLIKDPRVSASRKDLEDQFNLIQKVNQKLSELHNNVEVIRQNQSEISDWISRSENNANYNKIKSDGDKLIKTLKDIENLLVFTDYKGARDRLNNPVVLNVKLAGLLPVLDSADFKPTDQSYGVYTEVSNEIDEQLDKLKAMQESGLVDFQELVNNNNIPGLKNL